jgi:hypothetical protein
MIYARTENGIVTDTLRVDPHTIFPSAYASQFVEAPDEVQRGWGFDGTDYTAPPAPQPTVPQVVTMRQACLQLEIDGLLGDVEAIVAGLPKLYQIEWQRASVVQRNNLLVETVRLQKGMTPAQIDALFIAANQL